MGDQKTELAAIVGEENVLDDDGTLQSYSSDMSFAPAEKPSLVVRPANVKEVQDIIVWANKTKTPLVPVSSGPPHCNGDTVPGTGGAVIVELTRLKKILNIDRRNRMAVIETGVTYAELQPALMEKGMRLSNPLLPRANKSVIASLLEREPRLSARYQWSSLDPLRCIELVFGDGNHLITGDAGMGSPDLEKQWAGQNWQVSPAGPGQTDFYRFLSAAQGSMGIATWASLRCEVLPAIHKLYFVLGKKLEDLLDFTYKILKYRYADELFILNGTDLAWATGVDAKMLPPWLVLVGIAGRTELPEERVDFQVKDITDIAGEYNLELAPSVGGVNGEDALKAILNPSGEPYWKYRLKGACQNIFFISTLDKAPSFVKTMSDVANAAGYPVSDIGVYLQPRHQGVNCHCEFSLPYDPDSEEEVTRIKTLFNKASQALADQGAFFTRPYTSWADLAFEKDKPSTNLLKRLKDLFDPNGIMNPGKLCFDVKETREE